MQGGVRIVRHARYTSFQTAQVSLHRNLFVPILRRTR